MNAPPYVFFMFFVCMWILINHILLKMGWADLVEKFKMREKFSGKRIGLISVSINFVNYQNCVILKYDEKGMYLNLLIFFRLFYPPVYIPWTEIKDVRDKEIFLIKTTELIIGDPFVTTIKLRTRTWDKVRADYETAIRRRG